MNTSEGSEKLRALFANIFIDYKSMDEKLKRLYAAYEEFKAAAWAVHDVPYENLKFVVTSKEDSGDETH